MTFVRAVLFAIGCGIASIASACGEDEPADSTQEPIVQTDTEPPPPPAPPRKGTGENPIPGPAVECAVGGAVEVESNDTAQTANAFTELTFCGVLGTAQDIDYSTFTTPPGTKLTVFQAVIDGKVEFELSVGGGAKFGPGETAKFGSGTYLVKAFTKAGKTASYSYRVQFDP